MIRCTNALQHATRRIATTRRCMIQATSSSGSSPVQQLGGRTTLAIKIRRPNTAAAFSTVPAAAAASASSPPPPTTTPPPIIWTTHRLNSEQILKVDKIFHKILWLDLFESQMLNDLVNAKLGIVLTKKQRKQLQARLTALENEENNADGAEGGAAAVEEEAKPILFDLKLVGFDAKAKIKVIKEVRGALELGLKEAKDMVEGAPVTLQKNMQPDVAAALKKKLEEAGATIELTEV